MSVTCLFWFGAGEHPLTFHHGSHWPASFLNHFWGGDLGVGPMTLKFKLCLDF